MEKQSLFYAGSWIFALAKGLIFIIISLVLIHFFVVTIFVVNGASMEKNFIDGEYLLTDRLSYILGQPKRGDVVVLRFPGDPEHQKYIKRLIGLPGEKITIKNGKVSINNQELTEIYLSPNMFTEPNMEKQLAQDEYFLMGDNRINSSDSRAWGTCIKSDFIGKAILRIFPPSKWGLVEFPIYN